MLFMRRDVDNTFKHIKALFRINEAETLRV
jgi:hypothetical protein